ncbi:PAS domain S-box protein [Halorhabdus sp. CUG00001]|uniref:PAS domain S-box protein n=1 Tax=Halorhabdus sp. CUG00001 TaxID=2600297 RepID=UPI00131E3D4E|nr:PAS domain S-box protein [Halorhabdus sp. CUG00001]
MATTDSDPPDSRAGAGLLRDSDRITVLHVDDDQAYAEMVAVYLEREGDTIEVLRAESVSQALETIENEHVDCVVSDYDMGGATGLELLDAIREQRPDLPFILFTGKGDEGIASEAISAGVTDYIPKKSGTDQYTVLAKRIEDATRQYYAELEVEHTFKAIETAREGISFIDQAGTFLYVNDAYAETFGYEPADLEGEHWEKLYPDEHVEQVYEEILPAIPAAGSWSGESVHVCADGNRVIVDHALAMTDAGTLLCLVDDITEQKHREQTLRRERQRFERFVDAVEGYAIVSLDPEGFVTSWNDGAEGLLGYDSRAILGEHVSALYPEDKREAAVPEQRLDEARTEGTVEDGGWRVRSDGSTFWADVTTSAVFDAEGTHEGFLQVMRDISDQRDAGRSREHDRTFLEDALDVLEDVVYVLNEDGEIVRVTEQAVEKTGYERAELLSMDALELFADTDRARIRADIEAAFLDGASTIEAELVRKDGQTIPFEFRKRRLADQEGNVYVAGVGRDISERKRRERQLKRQLEQFEHFGSVVSHDLRTPLQTARGRLELAAETGEERHFEAAERALERMETLLGDLSKVMREGEFVSEVHPTSLLEVAQPVWESLAPGCATLQCEDDVTIQADQRALERLFENLFKNALEHAGANVTVTVGRFRDGWYIEDDGPGVPAPDRERIFEAGYSTATEGSGFGLASVRQLVVAHGWDITVAEGENGGARFEITDVAVVE